MPKLLLSFSPAEVEEQSNPRPGEREPIRARVTVAYRESGGHEAGATYLLETRAGDKIDVRVEGR
jgi:hypothetical protein